MTTAQAEVDFLPAKTISCSALHPCEHQPRKVQNMPLQSIVACLDRQRGSVLMTAPVSHMVQPVMIDPLHIMIGTGCGDWGLCQYLTIADAAALHAALGQILADQVARG
jgi:energy-converting hydrogenase Eha subunit C